MMIRGKRLLSLAFAGSVAALVSLFGADMAKAGTTTEGAADVLLTVTLEGEGAREEQLTLQDLQAFTAESFETATIWTTGPQSFTGVPLADLLAQFDLTAETPGVIIEARAVNDYMVEVPLSDAVAGGPLIAYLRNGKTMSLRGKGPLWLVYPYDNNPSYRTEAVYSRSIWQLDHLTLRQKPE
ncbi:molybdopterin-dependent oxidoreductase [Pseudophaeobacter arcticus]|uniref:molybdopterin-dependent oxidoreductase n=1 Tax=Pseudophaeobacter arcticus TaxID=385492 RepID=UPI003A9781D8